MVDGEAVAGDLEVFTDALDDLALGTRVEVDAGGVEAVAEGVADDGDEYAWAMSVVIGGYRSATRAHNGEDPRTYADLAGPGPRRSAVLRIVSSTGEMTPR